MSRRWKIEWTARLVHDYPPGMGVIEAMGAPRYEGTGANPDEAIAALNANVAASLTDAEARAAALREENQQ